MSGYDAMRKKDEIIGILNCLINQIENVALGIQNETSTVGGHVCSNKLYNMVAHYRNVRNIVRNTYIAPPSPQELTNQYTAGGGGRSAGGGGNGSRGGGSIASRGGGTR